MLVKQRLTKQKPVDNKYVIAAAAEGNRNKWKYLSGSACGCHDNLALLDFVE